MVWSDLYLESVLEEDGLDGGCHGPGELDGSFEQWAKDDRFKAILGAWLDIEEKENTYTVAWLKAHALKSENSASF